MPDRHAELIERVPELRPKRGDSRLEMIPDCRACTDYFWVSPTNKIEFVPTALAHALIERNIAEWLPRQGWRGGQCLRKQENGVEAIEWSWVPPKVPPEPVRSFDYSEALLLAAEAVIGGKDGEE